MEYRLDLSTLLLMLGQSTGDLHATLQNLPKLKGRCQIFLRLEKGSIRACTIQSDRSTDVISGEAAVKLIQNLVIEWHYTEDRPRTTAVLVPQYQQQPATISATSIPRRAYLLPQSELMSWPRLYRTVYLLIDGKMSVNYIVTLLGREQGAEQVIGALKLLRERGIIIFENNT